MATLQAALLIKHFCFVIVLLFTGRASEKNNSEETEDGGKFHNRIQMVNILIAPPAIGLQPECLGRHLSWSCHVPGCHVKKGMTRTPVIHSKQGILGIRVNDNSSASGSFTGSLKCHLAQFGGDPETAHERQRIAGPFFV